jgi:hypothetical protein
VNICAKVTAEKGDAVRMELSSLSATKGKHLRVSFRDDNTGEQVTKIVQRKNGRFVLEGLSAEKGKQHVFTVQVCDKNNVCQPGKGFFVFVA